MKTTRREAIAVFEAEYEAAVAFFRALGPKDLDRPVFGEGADWRVRDLPAHWAAWKRLAARTAEKIVGGTPWPAEGSNLRAFNGITATPDELNAETFAAWHARPLADCVAELEAAHAALMASIAKLSDAELLDPEAPEGVPGRFWTPGVLHFRLHREHLEAALKEGATTP